MAGICFKSVVKEDSSLQNCAVLDTACTHGLCGTDWLTIYERCLQRIGINHYRKRIGDGISFDFGGDNSGTTLGLYSMPAWPFGKFVWLKLYLIRGGAPYLASLDAIGSWGIVIDKPSNALYVNGSSFPIARAKSGHISVPLVPKSDTLKRIPDSPLGIMRQNLAVAHYTNIENPMIESQRVLISELNETEIPSIFNSIYADHEIQHVNRRNRYDISIRLGKRIKPNSKGFYMETDLQDTSMTKGREFLLEKIQNFCKKELDFKPNHFIIGWKVKSFPIPQHTKKLAILLINDKQYSWLNGVVIGSPRKSI